MTRTDPAGPFPADCAQRFVPVRLLAKGGFSEVWLAQQINLGRPAAVKIARHEFTDEPDHLVRFLEEARMNASVKHPNVVVVYDHGAAAGVPWIAYESHSGRTLLDRILAGAMPWREVCQVAGQIVDALEAAHVRGILHRDIKPSNVLEAGVDHYKLADFGIASWLDGSVTHTKTGVVLGTPTYLAPERINGAPATAAADLYAMGVILFEMLTGRCLFEHTHPVDIMRAHLESPPVPPSTLQPGIPPGVDNLVLRLLSKVPRRRPASARDLAQELSTLLEGAGGTVVSSAKRPRSPGPFWHRARLPLALAVVATVCYAITLPSVKPGPSPSVSHHSPSAELPRFRADLAKFNDAAIKIWARIDARFDLRRFDLEGTADANSTTANELSTALRAVSDLDLRCDSLLQAGDIDTNYYRLTKLELATYRFCLWAGREQYKQRAAVLGNARPASEPDVASILFASATLKARYSLEGLPYLEAHLSLFVPALKEALARSHSTAPEIRRIVAWGIGAASAFRMVGPEESAAAVYHRAVQKSLASLDSLPAQELIICLYFRDLWAWVLRDGGVSRERLRRRADQLDRFLGNSPDFRQWKEQVTTGSRSRPAGN